MDNLGIERRRMFARYFETGPDARRARVENMGKPENVRRAQEYADRLFEYDIQLLSELHTGLYLVVMFVGEPMIFEYESLDLMSNDGDPVYETANNYIAGIVTDREQCSGGCCYWFDREEVTYNPNDGFSYCTDCVKWMDE